MSNIGKLIGLLTLMNAVFPHEVDASRRDSDCIEMCKRCKKQGANKSPTGSHSYCFVCPLYEYSFMTGEFEKEE